MLYNLPVCLAKGEGPPLGKRKNESGQNLWAELTQ